MAKLYKEKNLKNIIIVKKSKIMNIDLCKYLLDENPELLSDKKFWKLVENYKKDKKLKVKELNEGVQKFIDISICQLNEVFENKYHKKINESISHIQNDKCKFEDVIPLLLFVHHTEIQEPEENSADVNLNYYIIKKIFDSFKWDIVYFAHNAYKNGNVNKIDNANKLDEKDIDNNTNDEGEEVNETEGEEANETECEEVNETECEEVNETECEEVNKTECEEDN